MRRDFWSETAGELASAYRLLIPDLPGHGGSDVPASPMSISGMASLIGEFLHSLGGDRFAIVGCSMGSTVAASLAAKMPERVAALILANSAWSQSDARHQLFTERAAAARKGMVAIVEPSLERWFVPERRIAQADLIARVKTWLQDCDPVFHSWCWEALRDFDYAPLLNALTMPTLVIVGSEDRTSDLSSVRALADALPDAEYQTIEGAGHLTPFEEPLEFAARLREFLARRVRSL
jgi:3-oxoadipate enol-lactonase